ncbi:MAG: DUF362 domain-containing protein [Thermoanaerobaculia bacterium]
MKSRVAVLKTTPESVLKDIDKLFELINFEGFFKKEIPIILKDNVSWHYPFLSANTTPWQLEGVILALKERGYKDISALHNETVVTRSKKGQKLLRLKEVYKKYEVKEYENFNSQHTRWIPFKPKAELKVLPRIYKKGIYIPEILIGKNIIHLPTLKTHIYTTTTGAMKNAFGGLLSTKRHYTHTWIHETLVDLLKTQKEIHPSIFAVMDGTISGEGAGPRTMIPHITNLILASEDQVAIDATGAKIMGFEPLKIDYLRRAEEEGLGFADPEKIEILGEDISKINLNYRVSENLVKKTANVLWYGPLKNIQYLFFHTPIVNIFILASYLYHDFFWWHFIGKKRMKPILESDWGKLFLTYPEGK